MTSLVLGSLFFRTSKFFFRTFFPGYIWVWFYFWLLPAPLFLFWVRGFESRALLAHLFFSHKLRKVNNTSFINRCPKSSTPKKSESMLPALNSQPPVHNRTRTMSRMFLDWVPAQITVPDHARQLDALNLPTGHRIPRASHGTPLSPQDLVHAQTFGATPLPITPTMTSLVCVLYTLTEEIRLYITSFNRRSLQRLARHIYR